MLVGALIVLGLACVAADDAYAAPDAPTIEFSPVVPSRVSPSNPFTLEALVRTGGAAATIEWSADVDDAALLDRCEALRLIFEVELEPSPTWEPPMVDFVEVRWTEETPR